MLLDRTDIEKIAWLARLSIGDDDIQNYSHDLSRILELVAEMSQIDTSNLEPMAHPLELSARLREDVVTETDERDHFQKIAPDVSNGHYLVPKVIE